MMCRSCSLYSNAWIAHAEATLQEQQLLCLYERAAGAYFLHDDRGGRQEGGSEAESCALLIFAFAHLKRQVAKLVRQIETLTLARMPRRVTTAAARQALLLVTHDGRNAVELLAGLDLDDVNEVMFKHIDHVGDGIRPKVPFLAEAAAAASASSASFTLRACTGRFISSV